MDLISDHFISYDEDFTVKQEKVSDPEVSFTLPFSLAADSTSFYPTLRNMLENPDLTIKQSLHTEDLVTLKKRSKPFKIIRPNQESSPTSFTQDDSIEVKIEPEKKVMNNSRREYRREVAKKKSLKKKEAKSLLSTYGPNLCNLTPESISNLNIDEKTGKKLLQMIRNRISAQNSRDRRKTYLQTLEQAKDVLLQENNYLVDQKNDLYEEVKRLQEANMKLVQEREGLLKLGKKQKNVNSMGTGALKNCLVDLELPSPGERDDSQSKGFKLSFQLALVLSVLMMMRLNEQGMAQPNPYSEKEQAKLFMPVADSEDLAKNSVNFLRKCSQSTTFSSHSSPLIIHNPLDKAFKASYCYNSGSDDEITTNPEHINSPLQEDKLKDFDLTGENLLMSMQGSNTMLRKGLKSHVGTSGAVENDIFSKTAWRMEGSQYL